MIQASCHFLDPGRLLVDEVADWLLDRLPPASANDLSRFLVAVPTAQSGRSLREKLAVRAAERGLGAVIPPRVLSPMAILRSGQMRMALKDELVAYVDTLKRLQQAAGHEVAAARRLMELAGRLETGGLRFADIPEKADTSDERQRWEALARFEAELDRTFAERGLQAPGAVIQSAVARPQLPQGITTLVLPALVCPTPAFLKALDNLEGVELAVLIHADKSERARFGRYGEIALAVPPIAPQPLTVRTALASELAAQVVADFGPGDTLGLADESLYTELAAAFAGKQLALHNPAQHPLKVSSFGRLLVLIREWVRGRAAWPVLTALVRDNDVRLYLERAGVDWAALLTALDQYHNRYLPVAAAEYPEIPECLQSLVGLKPTAALARIFGERTLDLATPFAREFAAAIRAGLELLALADDTDDAIFGALLGEAGYTLEPEPGAIVTEGWLELAWSWAERIHICGFTEGAVPDSINGHAYLPDAFAARLGLDTNQIRYARDAFLLDELLRSHPGKVAVYFADRSSAGDAQKPSRLLFRVADGKLLARARALLGKGEPAAASLPGAGISGAWDLRLPPLAPPAAVTPSEIDVYLRSPLEFFLRHTLKIKDPLDDTARELDDATFGTIAHNILHSFARSPHKESTDAHAIAGFLVSEARRAIPAHSVILELQQSALVARLQAFARWQAAQTAAGWRIHSVETAAPALTIEGLAIQGRYDRLDVLHLPTGEKRLRLIDYKTWNRAEGHGESRQLPLYAKMLTGRVDGAEQLYLVLNGATDIASDVTPDPADAARLEALIAETARRLRAADFAAVGDMYAEYRELLP
ncbi:MAG: PD-(D/E)XK nuclease family protein [Kiritimatiellae bacterium]|nr:PD-(D/E)XK nuclease family protein [Kiritimatiellia bacterium]